jgi:exopolysaccharide biosynthesis polyprenyl glycosylphosphotransferase
VPPALPAIAEPAAAPRRRPRLALRRGRPGGSWRRARRGRITRRALVAADVVGLAAADVLATLAYGRDSAGHLDLVNELLIFAVTIPCWVLVARLHGLYDRDEERADHSTPDDVVGVFHLVTIGTWLLLAGSYLTAFADPDVSKLIAFWILAIVVVPVTRTVARELCRRSPWFVQNTLIVGAGHVGQLVARKLHKHPEFGINVVGFIDPDPRERRPDLPEHLRMLGGLEQLADVVERHEVERVIVAFCREPTHELVAMIRQLRTRSVQVDLVPRLFDVLDPGVTVHTVEGLALLGLPPARLTTPARVIKRIVDLAGAGMVLLLTAPVFAYVALRIRLDSPGPVLFRQTRLGEGMTPFRALKFRTMRDGTDSAAHREFIRAAAEAGAAAHGVYKLDQSRAVTPVGRWLRRTSLDELPQLLNVLRGDMSLVGPRPCIPYEVDTFRPYQLERFLVPQGLTGLWQVTARANATFTEALDMDVAYVRGWSLGLDLRLLLRTPLEVVRQRGRTA